MFSKIARALIIAASLVLVVSRTLAPAGAPRAGATSAEQQELAFPQIQRHA